MMHGKYTPVRVLLPSCVDINPKRNCPRCRRPKLTSKRLSLARLPQFVVVHLKRFMCLDTISEKVDTPVKYPLEGLELGKFLPPMVRDIKLNLPHEKKTSYRLYGVVNHYRSGEDGLSSGHCGALFIHFSPCGRY